MTQKQIHHISYWYKINCKNLSRVNKRRQHNTLITVTVHCTMLIIRTASANAVEGDSRMFREIISTFDSSARKTLKEKKRRRMKL